MDSLKSLRILVVSQIVLTLLGVVLGLALEGTLPVPLQAYLTEENERALSPTDLILMTVAGLVLTLQVVAWVTLWRPRRRARVLYTAACAGAILLAPAVGPYVLSGVEHAIEGLVGMVQGLILGLLYFSDLGRFFGSGGGASGQAGEEDLAL